MGSKQMVSSAQQRSCTSAVTGQKVSCQRQCDAFGASAIFHGLVTDGLFLVSISKKCSEEIPFRERREVTAKAKRALRAIEK
jgi:hypothetical protein